ncbi:unnamed protein product, partial [Ectocarpus sp. 13 AM-2016]
GERGRGKKPLGWEDKKVRSDVRPPHHSWQVAGMKGSVFFHVWPRLLPCFSKVPVQSQRFHPFEMKPCCYFRFCFPRSANRCYFHFWFLGFLLLPFPRRHVVGLHASRSLKTLMK